MDGSARPELAEKRFDRSCSVGLFAGVLNELAKNRALAARLAQSGSAASFPNSRLGTPGLRGFESGGQ